MALRTKPNPTFSADVLIPVPGAKAEKITVEFKYMTRKELEEFAGKDAPKNRADIDTMMAIIVGWKGVDREFTREAVEELIENYHAFAKTVVVRFMEELSQAKLGN